MICSAWRGVLKNREVTVCIHNRIGHSAGWTDPSQSYTSTPMDKERGTQELRARLVLKYQGFRLFRICALPSPGSSHRDHPSLPSGEPQHSSVSEDSEGVDPSRQRKCKLCVLVWGRLNWD